MFINLGIEPMTKIAHREHKITPQIFVKALLDTGCSKTSISKKCFDMLNDKLDQNLPLSRKINISIQAATDNAKTTAYGITTLNLVFDEKNTVYYATNNVNSRGPMRTLNPRSRLFRQFSCQ